MEKEFDVIVYSPDNDIAKPAAKLIRTLSSNHMPLAFATHRTPPAMGVR